MSQAAGMVGGGEARPRVWTVFAAYALTFITVLLGSGVALAVLGGAAVLQDTAALEAVAMTPSGMIAGILVSCTATAGYALACARLSPTPLRARLRLGGGFDLADVALATIGALALGETFSAATTLLGWVDGSALDVIARATAGMSAPAFAMALLVGSLGAGIGEELFFRGLMQTRLVARWGPTAGVAVTALAFGLIHFDKLHTPFAIMIGLYFGWLTERRGTIVLAMIVHVLNNATSFVLMWTVTGESSTTVQAVMLAVSVPLAAAAIIAFARRQRRGRHIASTST